MRIEHALILAAGKGTRMMPLTEKIPKAMAPLFGSTMIARNIRYIRSKVDHIHVTVGYKGAMLSGHVISEGVSTTINTEGQDNSWWLYNSLLKHLNSPIFVLTCDNVIELDFNALEEDYFIAGEPACLIVPVEPKEGMAGDFIFHDNQKISELTRERSSGLYCSGIQVINPYKVNQITERSDNFYGVWQQLINAGQLFCSKIFPNEWNAVDTIEQLEIVSQKEHLRIG